MKRYLAFLLVVALLFSLSVQGFAEDNEAKGTDGDEAEVDVHVDSEDLSGQIFTEVFGDGSSYQVTGLSLADDAGSATVTYIAAEDCTLQLRVFDENSEQRVLTVDTAVPAGKAEVTVELNASEMPEHFWIDAVLVSGGTELSEIYSYSERTEAYQEFLSAASDDPEFEGYTVLNFGTDANGSENFAVVSQDVKVVYVDSMDEVEEHSDREEAALFGLVAENEGFVFTDAADDEVLAGLESGDKLLILPRDNVSDARVFYVENVEETAVLLDDGEMGSGVEVTASQEGSDLGDFFEFIRVNVEVDADSEDLDTSDADEDLVFSDDPVIDESDDGGLVADLFDSKTSTASHTVSWSKEYPLGVVKVKDTVSITAKVTFTINYKTTLKVPTKLTSVVAKSELTAKNVFNVNASKKFEYKMPDKKLGTIPIGTVSGVTFSIPVYLTFSASFGAEFDYTATNTVKSTTTVTYKNGSVSSSTEKSSSSTKELKTEAKATVMLGLKASLEVSFLKVVTAHLSAEAGIRATGRIQSVNNTSTYKHDAKVCLTVELDVYIRPSFDLKLVKKTLASKEWSMSTKRIATYYAHLSMTNAWSYGDGECPNRQYLITLKATDASGKAMKDVTVKEGSRTLGTTNSSGQLKVWLNMATHTLKFSKTNYTTGTLRFTVTGAKSETIALYKNGANEAYYTISELMSLTDEGWADFLSDEEDVANTIFRIQNEEDLEMLSEFAARSDRTTQGIRFVLNNASGTLDLSGRTWTPIGSEELPFRGELDGNGFTITGLVVNDDQYAGLFGCLEGALIHDLTLENVMINSASHAGALAGKAGEGAKVFDIAVSGTVTGATAGGIFGAMDRASLLNSYSTADVAGATVGGLAGSLNCSDTAGLIANCYAAGALSGSTVGGVCGILAYDESAGLSEEEDEVFETGIRYAYFPEAVESAVPGYNDDVELIAYAVSPEQMNGTNDGANIGDDGYAAAPTLLEALNNWYWKNGSVNATDEDEELPEASPSDKYNKWYADAMTEDGEGGYPIFAVKEKTYALTVHYVYEDGSEAFPSVTLYLTEGQPYDVDSYTLEGYHTYELEYKGEMPAYDLEYRVIYIKDVPYTPMTQLTAAEEDAKAGETYSISTEEELILFSQYVNGGRNTEGVTFVQLEPIVMSENSAYTPAGDMFCSFQGTFDGGYLGITNLKCSLFDSISSATINAVVLDITVVGTNERPVGGIAVRAETSTISSCIVTAAISGNAGRTGGIVSEADRSLIDKCEVSGSIASIRMAGGIVGNAFGSEVRNCVNTADITGENSGGLVGSASMGSSLVNCYSIADVTGHSTVGGLIGYSDNTLLKNVYQYGIVTDLDNPNGQTDALIGEGSADAESVWYPANLYSDLAGATAYQTNEAGIAALLDGLNLWVKAANSGGYLTWSESLEDNTDASLTEENPGTPVFGTAYTNWLLDLELIEGKLSYAYFESFYPDGKAYVAVYSDGGQLIEIKLITESAENIDTPDGTAYAKAFILTEDGLPIDTAIMSYVG